MSTTIKLVSDRAAYLDPNNPNSNIKPGGSVSFGPLLPSNARLLVGFPEIAAESQYKRVLSAVLYARLASTPNNYNGVGFPAVGSIYGSWNADSVTYNNAPGGYPSSEMEMSEISGWAKTKYGTWSSAYRYGAAFGQYGIWNSAIFTPAAGAGSAPYLLIELADNDASAKVTVTEPQGGYIDKAQAQAFKWALGLNSVVLGSLPTQTSAVFRYRSADGGPATEITINGNTPSYTVPANTFSAGDYEWQVTATNSRGQSATTEWTSFTTLDASPTTTAIAPADSVEDGSGPIIFQWDHVVSTGTAQTSAELQWKTNDTDWAALATVEGSQESCILPGGTLPGGTIFWRVRSYNSDGVAGEWSEALSFIAIAAPPTPVVNVQASPRPTVTWQASGQQAYRVIIGDYDSGPQFGTGKNYTLPEILPDGSYTAQVAVQNQFGLWSGYGSVDFDVQNSPGAAINLRINWGNGAILSWNSEGTYESYLVVRSDRVISEAKGSNYEDIFSVGEPSYKVIGLLPGGNYTESNTVTGRICIRTPVIRDIDGGSWLELKLTSSSDSQQSFSRSRTATLRHYMGARYPSLEYSEFYDKTGSYEASFCDKGAAEQFRELLGKTVVIKSRWDRRIIGGLIAMEESVGDFFASFRFTIQQIDHEEAEHDTDS